MYLNSSTSNIFSHYCIACKKKHVIVLNDSSQFNGNFEKPTFLNDIKMVSHVVGDIKLCHYSMVNGIITYHDDCDHDYAGVSVPLSNFPIHNRRKNDIK